MLQILLIPVLVGALTASAEPIVLESQPAEPQFTSYYEIDEKPSAADPMDIIRPTEWMRIATAAINAAINLLRWDLERRNWPEPEQRYDRRRHFGTWLKDDDCINTRAKVLMRSSRVPVRMSASGCSVISGEWHEPYAGEVHLRADEIQIDHMVPLKNAYVSGAWKWDRQQRCAYANFMSNQFHLIAVSGHHNMAKGDSTPSEWLPPNLAFRCEYLKAWLSVKLIWGLIMNPLETRAIQKAFASAHCDPATFALTPAELVEQRRAIGASLQACQ